MPRPRTIDSSSPHYAAATREAEAARHHAARSLEAQQATRFYWGSDHGLDLEESEKRLNQCLADGIDGSIEERRALVRLNLALLNAGMSVGDEVLVGRGIYLCCRDGRTAVHLGSDIPSDIELEEISNEAEIAERAADFAEMVRFPH